MHRPVEAGAAEGQAGNGGKAAEVGRLREGEAGVAEGLHCGGRWR